MCLERERVSTCRWLLTWKMVSPETDMAFKIPFGVAPAYMRKKKTFRETMHQWKKTCKNKKESTDIAVNFKLSRNLLSAPPSWLTASSNLSCSSCVQRKRSFLEPILALALTDPRPPGNCVNKPEKEDYRQKGYVPRQTTVVDRREKSSWRWTLGVGDANFCPKLSE